MMKECTGCGKETNDIFYLHYADLVDPFTGSIISIGNGFCLKCYMKKINSLQEQSLIVKN